MTEGAHSIAAAILLASIATNAAQPWFAIKVIDKDTGRGVPMVELETVNHIVHVTDSSGFAAFHEPGLMGSNVFFHVRSHGYEFRKDRFGFRGLKLRTTPGGAANIQITRRNIAERLYRITGAGIYRDSVLLQKSVPTSAPVLNGLVLGQDSVNTIPYRDRIHWFWGDSNRPGYPLGNFKTSGATSHYPRDGGLDPSTGINLDYHLDKRGFSRKMAPFPEQGLVWIFGLVVLPDESGRERMVAHYTRMKNLGKMLEHGLVVFNDRRKEFEKLIEFDLTNRWATLQTHPFRHHDGAREWLVIPNPLPNIRVPASYTSIQQQDKYEAFTCLKQGENFAGKDSKIERNKNGDALYAWKSDTQPIGPGEEQQLIRQGLLRSEEAHFLPQDVESGKTISMHFSTVRWNEYRQRWVMIGVQNGGDRSYLGEIWYGESRQPTGPWRAVRKIVTHDHYSFYNPCHHAFFDQENGRLIYFEGTYTSMFSKAKTKTPRYDYNQIMYRLDLADPRLDAMHSPH
ncbi:MAG: hypothetical protein ACJASX_000800 [Limisphaerales bacterium]|jgi:hypothetical protein